MMSCNPFSTANMTTANAHNSTFGCAAYLYVLFQTKEQQNEKHNNGTGSKAHTRQVSQISPKNRKFKHFMALRMLFFCLSHTIHQSSVPFFSTSSQSLVEHGKHEIKLYAYVRLAQLPVQRILSAGDNAQGNYERKKLHDFYCFLRL